MRGLLLLTPSATPRALRINRDSPPRNSFKLGRIGVTFRGKKINIAPVTVSTRSGSSPSSLLLCAVRPANYVTRKINHTGAKAIGVKNRATNTISASLSMFEFHIIFLLWKTKSLIARTLHIHICALSYILLYIDLNQTSSYLALI